MKTHQFDGISFLTGVVFLAIGILYLVPRDAADMIDLVLGVGNWFWPVLFLAVGAAVLIPALRASDETEDENQDV